MTTSTLAHKATLASIWVVGGRFVARIVDLASLLVLARILTPADFGTVAIATTILSLVEAILELPLNQALIRQPVLTKGMFDTAFTLGLLRGAAIGAVMMLAAWPLSDYYDSPVLVPLMVALSLAPALRGLNSPRLVTFMQDFDFRREFAIDIAGKLAAFFTSTTLALATGSYWALAAGTIVSPLTTVVLSYVLAPMAPRLTLSEWRLFKDMVGWNTLSQVISAFNWQFDRFLLPRYTSLSRFGAFSVADTLSGIVQQTFVVPLVRPLSAAYAKLSTDEERSTAYYRSTSAVVMVAAPLLTSLSILAEPAVRIVFGEKWLSAIPLLTWLSAIGLLSLPLMVLGPLVVALDRMRYGTIRMAVEMLVKTPATLFGVVFYGIEGALVARAVAAVAVLVANFVIVRHLIGMAIGRQIAAMLRPTLCCAAMACLLFLLRPMLVGLPLGLPLFLISAVVGGLALATFWLLIFASWQMAGRPKGLEAVILSQARNVWRRVVGRLARRASGSVA